LRGGGSRLAAPLRYWQSPTESPHVLGTVFGFRLMLNKRSQTNLCLDIGFGKQGSNAVYFAVQEAF